MDCLIEDRVRVDGYVDVNVCIVISHMCLHVIEIERARRKGMGGRIFCLDK